jgi:hypothetical protein
LKFEKCLDFRNQKPKKYEIAQNRTRKKPDIKQAGTFQKIPKTGKRRAE